MSVVAVLNKEAHALNREAGSPPIPSLYFLTDACRTPNPVAVARKLPAGACVIYRHFGAPERGRVARALARICRSRGLVLLIAADPRLARRVGADGVHWPERLARRRGARRGLTTAAVHSWRALRRIDGIDACLLSPIFPSASASALRPLGLRKAARLAKQCAAPVIALGGVSASTAPRLRRRGFAGLACVEALARA